MMVKYIRASSGRLTVRVPPCWVAYWPSLQLNRIQSCVGDAVGRAPMQSLIVQSGPAKSHVHPLAIASGHSTRHESRAMYLFSAALFYTLRLVVLQLRKSLRSF